MDKKDITPEEQFYIDEQMYFTEELNNKADEKIKEFHVKQKENRDDILSEIAKIILSYNVIKETMSLKATDKKTLNKKLSSTINKKINYEVNIETKGTKQLLKDVGKTRYSINNYIYSLNESSATKDDKSYKADEVKDNALEDIINTKVEEKLWSNRLWDNKNQLAKDLRGEIKDFLSGKTTVNEIEDKIKKKYNSNGYETKRLVQDNVTRVQEAVNNNWQEDNEIKHVMYMATLDGKVCSRCAPYDGRVFELYKKPVLLPQHPFVVVLTLAFRMLSTSLN